mgnify:CR=1 FL=1
MIQKLVGLDNQVILLIHLCAGLHLAMVVLVHGRAQLLPGLLQLVRDHQPSVQDPLRLRSLWDPPPSLAGDRAAGRRPGVVSRAPLRQR